MSLINRDAWTPSNNMETSLGGWISQKGFSFSKIWNYIIILLVILWWVFLLFSLYQSSHTAYIDNPTSKAIVVQLNDQAKITLPPWTMTWVEIKTWEYKVKLNDKDIWSFKKEDFDLEPLINPTKTQYVIESIIFGNWDFQKLTPDKSIKLWDDPVPFVWPFEVVKDLYIKKTWDYNVIEELPKTVTIPRWASYKIVKKIWAPYEFIEMYNKIYVSSNPEGTWSVDSK